MRAARTFLKRDPSVMKWNPLPSEMFLTGGRMHGILTSWVGTPYMEGQQLKKGGVDCIRFCCGVIDELFGYSRTPIEHLPADMSLHSPRSAFAAMKKLHRLYAPLEAVSPESLQPGDLLVVGPVHGGPGHLMIVGAMPSTIYHSTPGGVVQAGVGIPSSMELFKVYRFSERDKWA